MFRFIYVSVLVVTFASAALFIVFQGDRESGSIYADDNQFMAVEYLHPENDVSFSSELIDLTNDEGQNYFVNYRIKREQMRQETKEMLSLLLESDILETRQQAQKRWLELSDKISKEGEIENILKIQGFKDVVCDVNGKKVNIMVLSEELIPEEISSIKKVAQSVTGVYPEKIQIKTKF